MAPSMRVWGAISTLLAVFSSGVVAQDVDPIVIKGSKFFYQTNGTEFFIRGIAYQQDFSPNSPDASNGYQDPLADPSGCQRDLPYLRQLRTNTVRVYAIDPTKDHDTCMQMFAEAGIYVIADLGSPLQSINSNTPSWTTDLYQRYTSVVDVMSGYSNTLGFFAGNEIVSQPNQTIAAPFAKAAVRDMKAYIASKNYRTIGVGYATSDNQYIREQLAEYMNCGSDQTEAVDFWGYNVYSWCGVSTYADSGYEARVQEFSTYSVPVFLAEYGCIDPLPRIFQETPVLYEPPMDEVFSGGIVYLYFQEVNNYGLVEVNGNSVTTLQDFTNLKSQLASVNPTGVNSASYNPTNSPQACPTQYVNWTAAASPLPPLPDAGLCDCMFSSLSCVPASSLANSSYGGIFNYICGSDPSLCAGTEANGTTGAYGPYGMCSSEQQLGYVMDQYYSAQGASSSACDFSGGASIVAPTVAASCSSDLAVASSSVAAVSSEASSSTGAAAGGFVARSDWGVKAAVAVFVNIALVSGIGMVFL